MERQRVGRVEGRAVRRVRARVDRVAVGSGALSCAEFASSFTSTLCWAARPARAERGAGEGGGGRRPPLTEDGKYSPLGLGRQARLGRVSLTPRAEAVEVSDLI